MRGQVQRRCVQERKVEGAGEEDGWSVCAWGGSDREGGGNGRRWEGKVSEQVEVEVLLQERCESKRRRWKRGSEWKVRKVGAWVTGEVGYEKDKVGVYGGER